MAYNLIQFQHGMSLPEFIHCFGTEAACVDALHRARWPVGFVCPRYDGGAHCVVGSGSRRRFQFKARHVQTSMTAGTLFASTPSSTFAARRSLICLERQVNAQTTRRPLANHPLAPALHPV